ncbi:MAG: Gfo/Idh/MocA family oxidoreductase [Bryobacter sp.]|jgi:predicted dehydrogenase|nr:Gfo/Idh/MocA family oxidoreductase [Bryobacter sp.]
MLTPRRAFLGSLAAPAFARRINPNDTVRVGIIGLRGRGRDLIQAFHDCKPHNVEIVTLCDCDENVLAERASGYEKLSGRKLKIETDLRKVLEDKSIDAVGISTPNHWHTLAAMWGLQAGKHVYVEKPGSHTVEEGRRLMDAAAKYKLVVQHGTQNRSSPNIVEGIRKLKEGVIGRVYLARGVAFKKRAVGVSIKEAPVPQGLNWDLWSGPAPLNPFSPNRNRGWHLLFDYGNGDIGNQGVHELDIIRWALDLDTHPDRVVSMGGKYITKDDQQYPHVHSTLYQWSGRDVMVSFETRAGYTNAEGGMGVEYPFLDKRNVVGVIFVGTEGYMIIPDYSSYYTFLGEKAKPGPSAPEQAVPRRKGPSNAGAGDIANLPHFENFIQAVRAGDPSKVNAPAKELHLSCTLSHLANIAWRSGGMVNFEPKAERCIGNDAANRLLARPYRAPYTLPKV